MTTVAIIPARGGSVGIPDKNLRPIGGVPLVARAVRACRAAHSIDVIYVSTDSDRIAAVAEDAGAQIIRRPDNLSGSHASSESALVHALDQIAASGVTATELAFVQCTSPFVSGEDLDRGIELIRSGAADSAFSAIATYEFLWREAEPGSGLVQGQNHDARHRPRRQDREPDYRETGAFYVISVAGFREHGHRFFGRTAVVPVSELSALEIDTAEELALADAFAGVLDRAPSDVGDVLDVDALVTDFDGVHTPDTAFIDQDGHEHVQVHRGDGMGISMLRKAGVPLLILSRERNPVVTARARKVGAEVLQGIDDKASALRDWMADKSLDPQRVAYVGNDVNDLAPMQVVGWPIAVADAHPAVRQAVRLVLTASGGKGAVREACDRILASRVRPEETWSALSTPDAPTTDRP
ncbi:acylneuraminate cytidylyltransferase [Parenemella sanctibonifatiensis]|uniref:N-acylneuraminate cytidylyltransferase n=1 Tax=Parenemella sanctibonifatiensis TaxID=2016505 RepID=A0A255E4U2_9ACTN|nr:acylneuraminate cytidylyltransferase [Parenemella sanctibonifatiensis]OYN86588.1 acylneuraminate cytidylyltransferase [Parenemella sanctibonifatiensis]